MATQTPSSLGLPRTASRARAASWCVGPRGCAHRKRLRAHAARYPAWWSSGGGCVYRRARRPTGGGGGGSTQCVLRAQVFRGKRPLSTRLHLAATQSYNLVVLPRD